MKCASMVCRSATLVSETKAAFSPSSASHPSRHAVGGAPTPSAWSDDNRSIMPQLSSSAG